MQNKKIKSAEQQTSKQKVLFIAVRGKAGSYNRKYSDFVLRQCNNALDENESSIGTAYEIKPDELLLSNSDIRAELNRHLLNTNRFIVLLDEWEENTFNPNVWFECGVISTIQGCRITFIAKEKTNVPFDVGSKVKVIRISDALYKYMGQHIDRDTATIAMKLEDANASSSVELAKFKDEFYNAFMNSSNPFETDYDMAFLSEYGFNSLREFFKVTGIAEYLNSDSGRVEYIDGEERAFKKLTEAVLTAKKSLRTSRFAKQSIVHGEKWHTDFMNALETASYRVEKFDRIICMNDVSKWRDVYYALSHFCPQKTVVYLRKDIHSIKFELVIIDEEISFIHFYLPDNPSTGNPQTDEKIRSTLKIVGSKISKKLADIFDRLHHRDYNSPNPVDLSRTLLGIEEDKNGIITQYSKNKGCLSLEHDREFYEEKMHITGDSSAQINDALKLIRSVDDWALEASERTMYQSALKKIFSD